MTVLIALSFFSFFIAVLIFVLTAIKPGIFFLSGVVDFQPHKKLMEKFYRVISTVIDLLVCYKTEFSRACLGSISFVNKSYSIQYEEICCYSRKQPWRH